MNGSSDTQSAGQSGSADELAQQAMKGKRLASVTFILDYIQLGFDHAGLSIMRPPRILADNNVLVREMQGYCEELCSLVGTTVRDVVVKEEHGIWLYFEHATLEIPFGDVDNAGNEAAILGDTKGNMWIWEYS